MAEIGDGDALSGGGDGAAHLGGGETRFDPNEFGGEQRSGFEPGAGDFGRFFGLSDERAFELLREVRWGREGEPVCPECGTVDAHWFLPSRRQRIRVVGFPHPQ